MKSIVYARNIISLNSQDPDTEGFAVWALLLFFMEMHKRKALLFIFYVLQYNINK